MSNNAQYAPENEGLLNQKGGPAGPGPQMGPKFANVKMNLVWFAAACCVLFGGLFGAMDLLFTTIAPLDFLDEIYLMVFGGIMFVLDAPLHFKGILEVKQYIFKYSRFLTRLTGRGLWYIFLGTMTFATLWENSISYFLAVVLGLFVFGVGVFSTTFGYVKSRKLERVRVVLAENHRNGKLPSLYQSFAKSSPQGGLTKQECNDLAQQMKGISFDQDELSCIFNALTTGPRGENISMDDLTQWAEGKMVFL